MMIVMVHIECGVICVTGDMRGDRISSSGCVKLGRVTLRNSTKGEITNINMEWVKNAILP
jgi:hypothetical protein